MRSLQFLTRITLLDRLFVCIFGKDSTTKFTPRRRRCHSQKNAFLQEESSGSLRISEQVVQRRQITDAKFRKLSRSSCDKEDVEAALGRCLQAYEEYYQLAIEPETKSVALDDYYSIMINRKEFDERVEEWLRKVETPPSTHEQNLNTSARHVSPSQVESGTLKSKSSNSKSSSRASDKSKKAKADLLCREVELRSLMIR